MWCLQPVSVLLFGFELKLAMSVLVGLLVKEKIGGTFESSDRTVIFTVYSI